MLTKSIKSTKSKQRASSVHLDSDVDILATQLDRGSSADNDDYVAKVSTKHFDHEVFLQDKEYTLA